MDLTTRKNDARTGKGSRRNTGVDLSTVVYGRMPPQAKDLEGAILGACMLEKDAFDRIRPLLHADCFYIEANKTIFQAIEQLVANSVGIDLLTVCEQLERMDKIDAVGGSHYVSKLTNQVVSSAHIEDHAAIVYKKFLLREKIRLCGQGLADAYEAAADGHEELDKISSEFMELATRQQRGAFTPMDTALVQTMQAIETRRHKDEPVTGVPTGWPELNRITGGWQPTDLIVVAARPSVGKTAFALNLARNAALDLHKPTPVALFSLEMSTQQLVQRILSAESELWLHKIMRGQLSEDDMHTLYARAVQRLAGAPIYYDDTPALNVMELRAKARRLKKEYQVGLIIIDYLQLMGGLTDERRGMNRDQEIGNITRNLKALAKELQVPVIALSQLSRATESRAEGRPMLSDLRESGNIENDADAVLFLTRPDYQKDEKEITIEEQHCVDIRFGKHRNGALDTVNMRVVLEIQKWMDEEQYQNYMRRRQRPGAVAANTVSKPALFLQSGQGFSNNHDDEETPF